MTVRVLFLAILGAASVSAAGDRSLSLKNASDGYLVNGVRLPLTGPHHRVLATTAAAGFHFGTAELVGAIERAAKVVAERYPSSVLLVGNMSRERGGDIPVSVSHNSGRDADLPFYVVDARGRLVLEHGFVKFDAEGRSGALRFDVKRNWALVKALLTDRDVQVQWLFCANSLRKLLLEHARQVGEAADLVTRAEGVLGQPGNSSEHAEHFHMRLYCALHERLQGCLNYGTMHAWVDDYSREVALRVVELTRDFASQDVGRAVAAIRKVGDIRGAEAVPSLSTALGDARPGVREAAAEVLALLPGAAAATPGLVAALDAAAEPVWIARLVGTLAAVGDERAAPVFARVLGDLRRARPETRALAAAGLGHLLYPPGVPELGRALDDPARPVREAAASALERITNHRFRPGPTGARECLAWWKAHHTEPRLTWVRQGFARYHHISLGTSHLRQPIAKLVALIREGGAVSFNARALIAEATGYHLAEEHFTSVQLYRFYSTWLRGAGLR